MCRLRAIPDASAESLHPFVKDCIEPGSTVHTDGWKGYHGLDRLGYDHEVTVLRGRLKDAGKLLPRVHLVVSLLKRWLVGSIKGQPQASPLLSGRVHVPVQPAAIEEPRQAVLSARRASGSH